MARAHDTPPHAAMSGPLDALPDPLRIPPVPSPADVTLRPPGSKSLTNRALLLAALSRGSGRLRGALLEADDALRMVEALRALGAEITPSPRDDLVEVRGVGGRWRVPGAGVRLDLQNAGTATRFLAAAASLADGPVTIDGNARMRERPIGELAEVLPALGVEVRYLGTPGFPPLTLVPAPIAPENVAIELRTTKSSQFISALLMLGPWLRGGITVSLHGEVTSPPYIAMTLRLLDHLGAHVRCSEDLRILRVGPPVEPPDRTGLDGFEYDIEPDASGATYFWAAGAIVRGGSVGVLGIPTDSLQGDARFPDLLARMGARVERDPDGAIRIHPPQSLRPIEADLAEMPDAAMTLAAVCAFAPGRSVLRGLRTLRVKETDRIAALQNELSKIGVRAATDVEGDPDALSITPPPRGVNCSPRCPRVEFDTYDDHRMAMSMALIALRRPNCFVRDPACVRKTYPTFWRDLARLYGP